MTLLRALVLAGLWVWAPAMAQMDSREAIALQNQILELRRDLATMQQRGGGFQPAPPRGGGGQPNEITAQLLERVQSLEEEMRRLRGQADEQANRSRRQFEDLSKQVADLQFKLGQGGPGQGGPAQGGAASSATVGGGPPTVPTGPVRRTPELAMQEGNAALARRDYPAAEAAAREVLAAGRNTPRGADASFLLAQSLGGRRDWQAAAVAYDDSYKANRQGSRAADSLLGLAGSLAAINERQASCATLDKLRAEFTAPRADIREQAATLRTRVGCR